MTEEIIRRGRISSKNDIRTNITEKEAEESSQSSTNNAVQANHHIPPDFHLHSDEPSEKGGRLLSALTSINIVILGSALVSGEVFNDVAITQSEVYIFLTILMLLTIVWMLYYILCTSKQRHATLHKDSHAGPIWLRGGLALFGVCSLALDAFKIGYSIGYISCKPPINIIFPGVQALFIIIQTYFLWIFSKDCVQIHCSRTRCGLMLTLATNLMLWMSAVTDESIHQTGAGGQDPEKPAENIVLDVPSQQKSNNTVFIIIASNESNSDCECTTNICHIFQTGYYYLYPFNIEYSLFASAMAYVMWKNVGRLISHHSHHVKLKLHDESIFLGPILGITVLVAGVGILIVYEVQVTSEEWKTQALTTYYFFNIISLSLMSLGAIGGTIIYRFDRRNMDNHKNPSRSLDVALLLGTTLGQYSISYFSVIAVMSSTIEELQNLLSLTYSLLLIIQHTAQNIFIVEGLHRQPFLEEDQRHGELFYNNRRDSIGFPRIDSFSIQAGDGVLEPTPSREYGSFIIANRQEETSIDLMTIQTIQVPQQSQRLSWKRKGLKEISLFLLLSNIIQLNGYRYQKVPSIINVPGREFQSLFCYNWYKVYASTQCNPLNTGS
ncbi:proton channel OTOP2-like [Latimeria chalumnae]|uniref:proton channel OTOP2-like n=1 Tax=Latimeria chalumnae TaxID=7897 RepID=UPI00313AE099